MKQIIGKNWDNIIDGDAGKQTDERVTIGIGFCSISYCVVLWSGCVVCCGVCWLVSSVVNLFL